MQIGVKILERSCCKGNVDTLVVRCMVLPTERTNGLINRSSMINSLKCIVQQGIDWKNCETATNEVV